MFCWQGKVFQAAPFAHIPALIRNCKADKTHSSQHTTQQQLASTPAYHRLSIPQKHRQLPLAAKLLYSPSQVLKTLQKHLMHKSDIGLQTSNTLGVKTKNKKELGSFTKIGNRSWNMTKLLYSVHSCGPLCIRHLYYMSKYLQFQLLIVLPWSNFSLFLSWEYLKLSTL